MKALLIITILLSTINCFSQIEIELAFFDQFQNKVKKLPFEIFDFNDGKIKVSKKYKVNTTFSGKIRVFPKGYPFYTGSENEIVIEIPKTKKFTDTIVLNEVLSQRVLIQNFANSKRKTIYNAKGTRICDLEKIDGEVVKTTYFENTLVRKKEEHLDTGVSFNTVKIFYKNGVIKKEFLTERNKETVKFYDKNGTLSKYYIDKNVNYSTKRKIYDADGKLIEKTTIQSLTPSNHYGGD